MVDTIPQLLNNQRVFDCQNSGHPQLRVSLGSRHPGAREVAKWWESTGSRSTTPPASLGTSKWCKKNGQNFRLEASLAKLVYHLVI